MAPPYTPQMIRAFATIMVDHGFLRTVVADLQREIYHLVPKELGICIEELREKGAMQIDDLDPAFKDFLNEHELIFPLDVGEESRFPPLELTWHSPSVISNCIVEVPNLEPDFHVKVQVLIEELGCTRVLFITAECASVEDVQRILLNYDHSIARSIDVMSRFAEVDVHAVQAMSERYPRLRSWVLYNAPEDRELYNGPAGFGLVINYASGLDFRSASSCVDPAYFKSNISLYTEGQRYHTYHNRKLFIRSDGALMNAPSSTEVFGWLGTCTHRSICDVVNTADFRKYWMVTKALTDVCSGCEFRNLCVDSRTPSPRADGSWHHTNECNYNPYICKWKGEDGYRTLAECGVVSNADGFNIDHDRIAAINAELWGE